MTYKIRAIATWHYFFMAIIPILLQTMAVIFAALTNWMVSMILINILCFLLCILIYINTGAFCTTVLSISHEGIKYYCWFGLRHDVISWGECRSYGFLYTPFFFYKTNLLYFSKHWIQNEQTVDGMIQWKYSGDGHHNERPVIGRDFCQVQYSSKLYDALHSCMPGEMFRLLAEQMNAPS